MRNYLYIIETRENLKKRFLLILPKRQFFSTKKSINPFRNLFYNYICTMFDFRNGRKSYTSLYPSTLPIPSWYGDQVFIQVITRSSFNPLCCPFSFSFKLSLYISIHFIFIEFNYILYYRILLLFSVHVKIFAGLYF